MTEAAVLAGIVAGVLTIAWRVARAAERRRREERPPLHLVTSMKAIDEAASRVVLMRDGKTHGEATRDRAAPGMEWNGADGQGKE